MNTSNVAPVSASLSVSSNDAASQPSAAARRDGHEPIQLEGSGAMRLSLFGCSIEIGEITGISFSSLLGC